MSDVERVIEQLIRIANQLEKFNAIPDHIAMARGTIVLDENLFELRSALQDLNLVVIVPEKGTPDSKIIDSLLSGRILITKNSKDFVNWASSFNFGIIALDHLNFIDAEPRGSKNQTAKRISEVLISHRLWSKRHGFILNILNVGEAYRDLVD